jgi:hypothetical protein
MKRVKRGREVRSDTLHGVEQDLSRRKPVPALPIRSDIASIAYASRKRDLTPFSANRTDNLSTCCNPHFPIFEHSCAILPPNMFALGVVRHRKTVNTSLNGTRLETS